MLERKKEVAKEEEWAWLKGKAAEQNDDVSWMQGWRGFQGEDTCSFSAVAKLEDENRDQAVY